MDKPFPAEPNPFLTPYPPPGPAAPGIKPFKALDLAPPGQGGAWTHAQPQASPFLDRDSGKAAPAAETPAPRPAPVPNPLSHPDPDAGLSHIFAAQPPTASARPPSDSKAASEAAPIAVLAGPQASSAALRASATPRPGSGTEVRAKAAMLRTDADAASAEAARLPITTSPNMEGRPIRAYLGVVSVEIVIPKDILFRNPAPYGELHRIRAAEEQLQSVKSKAFEELAEKARALGADAVVGASLQFSQFDAVVFLCSAVGTAVKVG